MEKISKNTFFYDLSDKAKKEVIAQAKSYFINELDMKEKEVEQEIKIIVGSKLSDLIETINIRQLKTIKVI